MDWARRRFDADDDTLQDVFQDAVIALYNRVISGNTEEIDASPQAYLFGIAKNLLLKRSVKMKKVVLAEEVTDYMDSKREQSLLDHYDQEHDRQRLKDALAQLNESCSKIIRLFYYHRYSMEAIAHEFGYDNTDVVKSRKLSLIHI